MKTTIEYIKAETVTLDSREEAVCHIASRFGCQPDQVQLQREADDDDDYGYDMGHTAFVPGNPNAVAWLS